MSWDEKDLAAWVEAAVRLKADGWSQKGCDHGITTYFYKPGQPTQRLVRNLGYLNWHPRPSNRS